MSLPPLVLARDFALNLSSLTRPRLANTPVLAGAVATGVGVTVLLGWLTAVDPVKALFLGPIVMKANTAVCFVLAGVGVILLARPTTVPGARWIGAGLLGGSAAIALASLAQYVTGIDLGIDQVLFRESPGQLLTVGAGRMSPVTSVCFALIALGGVSAVRGSRLVLLWCGAAAALSALNVFSFVFDAAVPPFLAGYSQMALNTAVAMGILAVGVIGLLGPASPFAMLARPTTTARLLRRILAFFIVVPLSMAWLAQAGVDAGFYDTSYGTALRLVVILVLGVTGVIRWANWTERLEQKREALELERDRFFEQSLDLMAVFDVDGRFRRANRSWELTLGHRIDELLGRSIFDLVHADDLERTLAESKLQFDSGSRVVGFQNRVRHRDGSYRWLEWTSSRSPDGSVAFSVAREITDRRQAEDRRTRRVRDLASRNEALKEHVYRDALTGLHNRRFFDRAIAQSERRWHRLPADRRSPVAVIIFDLDHFGAVNKDHGHQAGDEVLRQFAELLERRFRERDLIVRYGGEEFVAVLEGASSEAALEIAEGIRADFERQDISIGAEAPIRVTVSAGCSQLGADGVFSSAFATADVWLSQAKRAGRNQVVGL